MNSNKRFISTLSQANAQQKGFVDWLVPGLFDCDPRPNFETTIEFIKRTTPTVSPPLVTITALADEEDEEEESVYSFLRGEINSLSRNADAGQHSGLEMNVSARLALSLRSLP